jgi:uncharacterized membrane protein
MEMRQDLSSEQDRLMNHGLPAPDQECRNCHEPGGELIAPCRCSGSIKWVHRSCLNEWRAVSPNPTSFSQCDVCGYEYELEYQEEGGFDWSKLKFAFLLSRDFLIFFAIINAVATLCSLFMWGVDRNRERDKFFTDVLHWSPPHLFIDWVYGWALFFFVIGLLSIFLGIAKFCNCFVGCCDTPTHSTYNYGWGGYYCYVCWIPDPAPTGGSCGTCSCNDCNVGHCHGDCGGGDCKDGAAALLVILIIIIIAIIVIGVVVAVFLGVTLGMRIVARHLHVLQNRHRAGQFLVVDLSQKA